MAEKVTGFFADLKLAIEEGSFKKGIALIKKTGATFGELAGFAKKAFAGLGAITGLTSVFSFFENQNVNVANSLGISVEQMKSFKYAAELAGLSGDDFVKSLDEIQRSTERLSMGELNTEQIKGLQSLGGVDLTNMVLGEGDVTDKVAAIFDAAAKSGMSENKIRTNLSAVLGDTGRQFYINMKNSGTSFSQLVKNAKGLQLSTNADSAASKALNQKIRVLKVMGEELSETFTGGFASGLMPKLKIDMSEGSRKEMAEATRKLGEDMGKLIGELAKKLPEILDLALGIFQKVDSVMSFFGAKTEKQKAAEEQKAKESIVKTASGLKSVPIIGDIVKASELDYVKRSIEKINADISSGRIGKEKGLLEKDSKILIDIKDATKKGIKIDSKLQSDIDKATKYVSGAGGIIK